MCRNIPIFDGHNDALLRLFQLADPIAAFRHRGDDGHLDIVRAKAGGFAGGIFACFVPSAGEEDAGVVLTDGGYTMAMPEPLSLMNARAHTDAMIACADRIVTELFDQVRLCRSVSEIRRCMDDGVLAMTLHLEGAEAIGEDLDGFEHYYSLGVRSIGPVWSRRNCFGTGVPFRYPGGPAIGPGLTEAGLALVRACDERGIMLDLSHLNAAGFWDVARTSRAPLVATHSNAHAVCPVPRNLTDDQLRVIRDSGGLVGVSLSVCDLRPDGHNDPLTPLDVVIRHMDHLLSILGPDGVAIGSDFDGAVMPAAIGDAGGLKRLVAAMDEHGYDENLVAKLCHVNWRALLERCWH
jgi:membrane dipeptidase